MAINISESSLFYTNQILASLVFTFGFIAIDRFGFPKTCISGDCKKQITILICLTTVFAFYNLITQIEYSTTSFILYDNYSTITYIINGLEVAVLAFYGVLRFIEFTSLRNLHGSFGVSVGNENKGSP